jgi:signal transduction histidine kinase
LGALARSGRARARALEEKAAQLEREREADAARAVAEERARIARDMHDVLAHAVSIMVVQAEAGPVVVRSDPGRAEQALDAIAAAGRDAMVQLQRMLGVLNAEDSGAIRAPHPTLEAIPALVAQVRHTDLRVELRTTGERRPLSGDVEAAAYRIVQEALTNTVRHAAASLATVRLDWEADDLAIAVTDDGQGQPPARVWTGGHGLIGIHERAAACGGRADTGPAPGGGFQVTARLPYTQAERPVPRSTSVGRAGWASPHSGDADLEGR